MALSPQVCVKNYYAILGMVSSGSCRSKVVCAIFIFLAALTSAQNPNRTLSQYAIRLYTTEQGLPQNEVRSIAQTNDGYLWFGTRDGLARFDGIRFTVFRHETTPGIGHNMLGAMLLDHLGALWIATGDGLSRYDHGKFRRYTEKDGLPGNAVHSLLEDRQGKLWVGTWNGLAFLDGDGFRVLTLADGLHSKAISGLADDGGGGVWVGTYGSGLFHVTGGGSRVLRGKNGLPGNFIRNLFHDREGRLWIGTLTGSALMNPSGEIQSLPDLPGQSNCFYEDRYGTIWASTDKTFSRRKSEPGALFEPQSIPNPDLKKHADVESLFQDRDGSLWIGTNGEGVSRFRPGPIVPYTTEQGLVDNATETVLQDSRGRLWVGTTNGLSEWINDHFRTIPIGTLGNGHVRSIAEDKVGRVWVSTSVGIARFDGHTWVQLSSGEGIPADIHALYCDRRGRMWIGSPEGVTVWDQGHITKIAQADGLPGNYVMSILEDRQGAMWIGTISGLAKLDNGNVSVYTTTNGLLSNYIQSLYEDSVGMLWICTPSGLHRLKNGHISSFTVNDGMFADGILAVIEDDRNRFWMSSYRGIFTVSRDDLTAAADESIKHIHPFVYGTEDGMKSDTCAGLGMQPAGWKARDGTIWFPTEQGVVRVDPPNSVEVLPPPTPVLESIEGDGVQNENEIFGPGIRRMDFRFTAPTSVQPEGIAYRYRLRGYEDKWHEVGAERVVSFTNLPSGPYQFQVSARRVNGDWSAPVSSSTILLRPHFYETRIFSFSAVILVIMLIWIAHSMRMLGTEQRLNAIMLERSRVAQELHDTLLQSVSGAAMEIRGALQLLNRGFADAGSAQLAVALDDLGRGMADARQAIWDLRSPISESLSLDASLELAARRVCSGGPELMFSVSGRPQALPQSLERHLYRIGIEAVINAVRHANCRELDIELEYTEQAVTLVVRDNGRGFCHALSETAAHSNHWGLAGMKLRAQQCSAKLTIETALGKGTCIRVTAPVTNGA